ncbi:MAG: VCBS repeat-containing protein [Planctomycetes bacterium]|nr:VCBS repeat-containing protein [Planctomycetota bacterium]
MRSPSLANAVPSPKSRARALVLATFTVAAVLQQVSAQIQNVIPIRFVHGLDTAQEKRLVDYKWLQESVRRANEVFAPAGIKFWIKSVEAVVIPDLNWRNDNPMSWSQVFTQLRRVFPGLVPNHYHSTLDVKPARVWADVGSSIAGDPDEILVWLMKPKTGSGSSTGAFPNAGRRLFIMTDNLWKNTDGGFATTHLAHELGHFFGVRHVFSYYLPVNPKTKQTYDQGVLWDVAYGTSPLSFFSSRASCNAYTGPQSSIAAGASFFGTGGNTFGVPYAIFGRTRYDLGSSALKGVLFRTGLAHNPPQTFSFGLNVMDYYSNREVDLRAPAFFSESQVDVVRDFVTYDQDYQASLKDSSFYYTYQNSVPTGVSSTYFTSLRTRLGKSANDLLWLSNGDMSFANRTTPISNTQYEPISGDFNGDGLDDIIWYHPSSGAANIWWATGNGLFQATNGVQFGTGLKMFAGDFDGNGHDDLYLYRPGAAADFILWGYNHGNFFVTQEDVGGTYEPVVADLDGDGDDDIVWYYPSGGYANVWWSVKTPWLIPIFDRKNRIVVGDGSPYTPIAGRFAGPNHSASIYWYRPGAGAERLWRASGPHTIGEFNTQNVSGTYLPIAGDFDGDGFCDIYWDAVNATTDYIWRGGGGPNPVFDTSHTASVYGSFKPVAGDFDGDGNTDIFWYRK